MNIYKTSRIGEQETTISLEIDSEKESDAAIAWGLLNGDDDGAESEIPFGELQEAVKPLLDFLNKYYDPMCYAVVTEGRAEVLRSEMGAPLPVRD